MERVEPILEDVEINGAQIHRAEVVQRMIDRMEFEFFIGPSDLSASMGYLGNIIHPDVLATIERGITDIRDAGKAPGILMGDEILVRRYLELGCTFIAVGADAVLFAQAVDKLAAKFKAMVS